MSAKWVDDNEAELRPAAEQALVILKFIGLVLWTIVRICLIMFLAIVLGGFRGAAKSKSGGTKVSD